MTSPHLYKGERLETIESAPTLIYFERGTNSEKPVVVFIPGAAHLARIAYGGHQGYQPSDFLAHWFQKSESGHSFLALSYPLECTPPVMPVTRPDFTVCDWGAQAAEATRLIIEEQHLPSRSVILLMWSMGGKILQSYTQEARKRGLTIELAISLVATPALRGLREPFSNITASPTGYASLPGLQQSFLTQLHEQNSINSKTDHRDDGDDGDDSHNDDGDHDDNNSSGRTTIISDATYINEYTGSFPITLGSYGFRWDNPKGKLLIDTSAGFEAADEMGLWELPYMGAIYGDSPLDFRHSTADRATWTFLMTYQLMSAVKSMMKNKRNSNDKAADDNKNKAFYEAMGIIPDTTSQMCGVVKGGTHFLFVGERGARETVEWVMRLQERLEEFKKRIAAVL